MMDLKKLHSYLYRKVKSEECFPFGSNVMVFKVMGKMFALLGPHGEYHLLNLKCDPDEANVLRKVFKSIIPGYHMNKTHWNSIILDRSVPDDEIKRMIDNSYQLIVSNLKKTDRMLIESYI